MTRERSEIATDIRSWFDNTLKARKNDTEGKRRIVIVSKLSSDDLIDSTVVSEQP